MNTDSTNAEPSRYRQDLTVAILFRIADEIEEVLQTMPPDTPEGTREAIREDILSNSRYILGALSIGQLENPCSLDRHIDNSIASAEYYVHRIAFQRSRS